MRPDRPTATDIEEAGRRIRPLAIETPLVAAPDLGDVWLKPEGLQRTGSFKVRGAANRILTLDDPSRGVVTASTGNHGRAVADVARSLGIPAAVCLSTSVPPGKVMALEALGCELVVGGDSQDDALVNAERLVAERGMTLVHPFDDPEVIAGQGTIGMEIASGGIEADTVLVPLSGGGLAAGIAVALAAWSPDTRVIGVSMARSPVMAASLERGEPVAMPEQPTLADSLQGGIGLENRYTFGILQSLLADVVLVDEADIWRAMRWALGTRRLVLEGGAAVGVAALLSGRVARTGTTVVVCSGANIEPHHLAELADELATDARKAARDRRD